MEDILRRSGHRVVGEEEKRVDSVVDHKEEIVSKEPALTNMEGSSSGHDLKASSSSLKKEDDQLESARAEMGEVREENQRLKMYLDRVMKDYQTLQMRFYDVVQQEAKKSKDASNDHQEVEEPLVSLSLGRIFSSDSKNDEKSKSSSQGKEEEQIKEDLSLGLDCKFEVSKSEGNEPLPNPSPANSSEEQKELEPGETWPPSKVAKTMRSGDEEILQQNPLKKARVSVRARCDTPTMNDGCQWRKYGQKIAKGNPCPRAYYRCTVAPSCPVRKQVQRCAEDMSILTTTYEGTHNHPLPVSATAIASTTSAAASMLLSGSSSSSRPGTSAPSTITAANSNLHGLNFYLTDNSKTKQFYLPNPSLSSSPSYPTITLDLTTAPNSSSSHFSRFSTSNYPSSTRYASTSLSFSSSESNSMSWGNGSLSYVSTQPYIKNQIGALNLGRQPLENIYESYMQKNNATSTSQHTLAADTIAAATKAITADPSFQSALAAALTSIIGTAGNSGGASQVGGGDNFVQKLKWGEHFPVTSSYSETVKGSGCAPSYLNKSSTTTSDQAGSLIFLPPSLPLSTSKSASLSPGDNREHNN